MATLVWDAELKAYQYFDPNYDFRLNEINTKEQNFLNAEEISKRKGFSGKPVSSDGVYYLPICSFNIFYDCQLQFDHVQFMLKNIMINNLEDSN